MPGLCTERDIFEGAVSGLGWNRTNRHQQTVRIVEAVSRTPGSVKSMTLNTVTYR